MVTALGATSPSTCEGSSGDQKLTDQQLLSMCLNEENVARMSSLNESQMAALLACIGSQLADVRKSRASAVAKAAARVDAAALAAATTNSFNDHSGYSGSTSTVPAPPSGALTSTIAQANTAAIRTLPDYVKRACPPRVSIPYPTASTFNASNIAPPQNSDPPLYGRVVNEVIDLTEDEADVSYDWGTYYGYPPTHPPTHPPTPAYYSTSSAQRPKSPAYWSTANNYWSGTSPTVIEISSDEDEANVDNKTDPLQPSFTPVIIDTEVEDNMDTTTTNETPLLPLPSEKGGRNSDPYDQAADDLKAQAVYEESMRQCKIAVYEGMDEAVVLLEKYNKNKSQLSRSKRQNIPSSRYVNVTKYILYIL